MKVSQFFFTFNYLKTFYFVYIFKGKKWAYKGKNLFSGGQKQWCPELNNQN